MSANIAADAVAAFGNLLGGSTHVTSNSTSTTTTPIAPPITPSKGLSTGAIIGIVSGSVLLVGAIITLIIVNKK